jgi:hypothetical protein
MMLAVAHVAVGCDVQGLAEAAEQDARADADATFARARNSRRLRRARGGQWSVARACALASASAG